MIVPAKNAMLLRRILLWPFTLLYGFALVVRHALYDAGLRKRTRLSLPTIAIGNLALGGTGKTPMLEAILRILTDVEPVATLSRGYGRTGNDIHEVHAEDLASRSGDEPVQIKRKFPTVRVFVGADRVNAIERIQRGLPELKAVVLDDALQHRRLDAGMNILLTTWARPYSDDALLPVGRLRDLRSRAKVAQMVVVTKCPSQPNVQEEQAWRVRLGLRTDQLFYFAGIRYEEPRALLGSGAVTVGPQVKALLFTGIADPEPLLQHARTLFGEVEHVAFPDHHDFTRKDLTALAARYAKFAPGQNVLITTEKDATRLSGSIQGSPLNGLPVAVIGMQAIILNRPETFADHILRHVATHPANR